MWLGMMRERLVLMDEVFGRTNLIASESDIKESPNWESLTTRISSAT